MSATVVKDLQKAGVNAKEYSRGPLGKHVMALRVAQLRGSTEGNIGIWQAGADFKVYGDKSWRQAVLRYIEKDHEIDLGRTRLRLAGPDSSYDEGTQINRGNIRSFSLPRLPEDTEFFLAEKPTADPDPWDSRMHARLIAKVPDQDQSVLVGMDETYHFIAGLNGHPKTVEGAHRMLRPKGLRRGAVRQGEWFFDPATAAEKEIIFDRLKRKGYRRNSWGAADGVHSMNAADGNESSHVLLTSVIIGGQMYAIGYVYDTRTGHHAPLHLPDWHRVVRNAEIEVEDQEGSSYTWD